ncbi:succinylglutamate-semialdehyde dehydrogenase [Candidatus Pantoea carbekii]|uniref:succinylglutamate-semialdehyde dehydrogenase n=1 Tax=Candidatus Pantoea carbekii TaxID=1235990 RepID=UPI0006187616|nr:succinylglutamate-semialdehyde dehydrogenase [Candidatus Pantoea carbekii]AKC32606.1 Succinylglutamic semialdehyde dehydrogenase astD [Candidatus Pantoea carbekii]
MSHLAHFISGKWCLGKGPVLIKRSPENQDILWKASSANIEDVQNACLAARAAFYNWSHLSLEQRITIVQSFATRLSEQKEQVATLISQETSKPLWETRIEVQSMIYKASISQEAYSIRTGFSETLLPNGKIQLRHKPHGVMAVFGPYNFPGHLPNGHIIPALIAGNTIVFKPSEFVPATAELIVQIWQDVGLPNGVLNLIQGDRETGNALLKNIQIDGVLFTGSAAVGCYFHRFLSGQPEKILALEMGGNNALIIDSYTNFDAVIRLIIESAFISAGQRCTCARRLLVKFGPKGDALIARLVEASRQIKFGKWNADPQPFMGGLISLEASSALLEAQRHLINLGASSLLRMEQLDHCSTIVTPGIIDITNCTIPDEEYFGPLLTIIRYKDFDEAVYISNNTRYGLAVGLVSTDALLFNRLTNEARAGIVNWNTPLTGASSKVPFGGIGCSGNYRPSAYYAADYCAWPMVSLISESLILPTTILPGLPF